MDTDAFSGLRPGDDDVGRHVRSTRIQQCFRFVFLSFLFFFAAKIAFRMLFKNHGRRESRPSRFCAFIVPPPEADCG